jgi:uncharacterized protein YqjF (DUF2071 family)
MATQPTLVVPVRSETERAEPRTWRWSQDWRDVLFAHWQVPAGKLRPFLPTELEPDTWGGVAWVSAVAFRLERVRLSWFPGFGPVPDFVELNLRTYVRRRGESAIYFLSMHANSRIGVTLGRWFTPLPYAFAPIDYACSNTVCRFHARRRRAQDGALLFRADFAPRSAPQEVDVDSLDCWLLERYCAFLAGRRGKVLRMVARHPRWQAQAVNADVTARALGSPWNIDLARSPDLCHFSPGVHAQIGPFDEA